MSQLWNGSSLVTEFSTLLGDTSTAFKSKVLAWSNDVIFDIATRHDWANFKKKGKKVLTPSQEEQVLEVAAPSALTAAIAVGGSLTDASVYYVKVTYVQANGVETLASVASAACTATASDRTINLSAIPVSSESLVTARNIYLKKDSGAYYYSHQIANNTATTSTITSDTSSTVEPPDYEFIRKISGALFFEAGPQNYLQAKELDQLRRIAQGSFSVGNPEYYSLMDNNSVVLYPLPSTALEVSFNYYRNPFKLYNSSDSQPDLPIFLKQVLKAGVIAMGYEYRDRDGQEGKRMAYEQLLTDAFSRYGIEAEIESSVRDVYGNSDGFEVN
jgi:hypothetical protein